MSERVFWRTCKYSADGRCSTQIVDEPLSTGGFTESGKKVPGRLYASPDAVSTGRRLRSLEYTVVDSEKHRVYAVSQQGFYYYSDKDDPEKDDPEKVKSAKKRIAVAVARPRVQAITEQRRRLDETETALENLVAEVGRI